MLILPGVPNGAGQLAEGISPGALAVGDIGLLPVAFCQGQGAAQPPQSGDQEGQHHGGGLAQTEAAAAQHQHQAENKGNHRADVAIGVAHGGNGVHPAFFGDFRQHGVIKHNAGGIAHPGGYKNAQEQQPPTGKAQQSAADDADCHAKQEQGLLEIPVGQCAADGSDDSHQHRGDGAGIAPVAQVQVLVHSGRGCQGIEINGNQSGHHENKGRIADIIENPAPLQCREFEGFVHVLSPLYCFLA